MGEEIPRRQLRPNFRHLPVRGKTETTNKSKVTPFLDKILILFGQIDWEVSLPGCNETQKTEGTGTVTFGVYGPEEPRGFTNPCTLTSLRKSKVHGSSNLGRTDPPPYTNTFYTRTSGARKILVSRPPPTPAARTTNLQQNTLCLKNWKKRFPLPGHHVTKTRKDVNEVGGGESTPQT